MLELADRWIWDSWYVDVGDAYHAFYLQVPRSLGDPGLRHVHASVGHAVSTDLVTWKPLQDALAPGPPGAFDDVAIWTGCVVATDDGWAMFYTGLTSGFEQRIGTAWSDDLISWRKDPANPVLVSDGRRYEATAGNGRSQPAWRDPWVYRCDDEYRMLITARAPEGTSRTHGVIGQARSSDLVNWVLDDPLTSPSDFAELEVPQLIEVGGRAVVIFSCGPRGLSDRRRAEPSGGGGYYLVLDGEPTSSERAVALDLPGLYACRVVWDRGGEPCVIGFHDEHGADPFAGTLSDPVPLRLAAPGLFTDGEPQEWL